MDATKMSKKGLLILLMHFGTCLAAFSTGIIQMRVNNLALPFGIDQTPIFSWVITAQERGGQQTAYEIEVKDNKETQVWRTGKVSSADSYQIMYGGKELKSKSIYRWRVRIWDQNDQCSAWSEWHSFETAMLSASDWKSQWIRAAETDEKEDVAQVVISFNHPVSARFIRIDAQKLGLPVKTEANKFRMQISEIQVLDAEGNNLALNKKAAICPYFSGSPGP